jgi:hypothetical protein
MGWRSRDCPCLVVGAVALALNDDLFADAQKRQENINIHIIVSQMADVDLRGAGLRARIPENVTIAGVSTCRASVGAIQEQI